MDTPQDLANREKDILIGLISIFLASCLSYWSSEYLLDYGWISEKNIFWVIFTSITSFMLIPFAFWYIDRYFKKLVDSMGSKGAGVLTLLIAIIICYTLAKLITGKIS